MLIRAVFRFDCSYASRRISIKLATLFLQLITYMDNIPRLKKLDEEPESFWTLLLKDFLIDRPKVVVSFILVFVSNANVSLTLVHDYKIGSFSFFDIIRITINELWTFYCV